jgi:glycosyltransferase involved in cell wall biosynthesis
MYWHFAGFGVNALTNPEQVEHLGITPLEAMAARTIPFCYNEGGPRELIESGKNGFLFKSSEELLKHTSYFLSSPSLQSQMGDNAYQFANKSFRYNQFADHVKKIFHII